MASATELFRALASGNRLEFFAHINPKVWEVVGGGPLGLNTAGIAALNPQPLPPVDIGQQRRTAVSYTAIGYGQLAMMAMAAIGQGEGGTRSFMIDIDDWCGTGWPRKWPWPPPKSLGRDDLASLQLGAGIAAAHLAAGYEGGPMQELFEAAATQLFDTAIAG
ncbi:hypothetical protein [Pseudactinotalea sp.]|uniref:hypothetical protein n=1 Tax=Pseudactinotalea sp. TaxID=1926260 RepID=UPI003B3B0C8C